ncbi:MAG TPA: hypothetical protein DHV16_09275 [Nitrospiraceae bacterium]|nr:MAG: hypothetical protein A2X55_03255 [Nitrospirae bacterium GWB2_47_37]HAK87587.1 hypothetical protein [Nitrospiraceae bacterium]HCZ12420.1 hypothetical protein [Nitrospiraceae bacterium]
MKANKFGSILIITFLTIIISTLDCFAIKDDQMPDGLLEVAYRQLTDGKLSDSIHNIVLICFDGNCEMTTLTLNQCYDFSDGEAFYPVIQRSTTRDKNMTVNILEPGVMEVEERDVLGATFKYRFIYTAGIGSNKKLRFNKLIGFSGAVVKQSDALNKVLSWELVPLKGQSINVKLKCAVNLKGVPNN